MIVIQHITVKWTKLSRGGAGAVKRNAVPSVAPLFVPTSICAAPNQRILHRQFFYEGKEFDKPAEAWEIHESEATLDVGGVHVLPSSADVVRVRYQYDSGAVGMPLRFSRPRELTMGIDEWAQFVYNGRFDAYDGGAWWYEKHVVNIGVFVAITPRIFSGAYSVPNHRHSDIALLI